MLQRLALRTCGVSTPCYLQGKPCVPDTKPYKLVPIFTKACISRFLSQPLVGFPKRRNPTASFRNRQPYDCPNMYACLAGRIYMHGGVGGPPRNQHGWSRAVCFRVIREAQRRARLSWQPGSPRHSITFLVFLPARGKVVDSVENPGK